MSISKAATTLPANLPDIASATLPASYERAKTAIAACARVDECKDWADKAAALASYAKQADDPTLHDHALRIQSRAIRRAGELLETFQSPGGRPPKTPAGDHRSFTQREAAKSAGMSAHQEKQAVSVARIPAEEFDAVVDGEHPPTVTELAERGTVSRPRAPRPDGFAAATEIIGELYRLKRFCEVNAAPVIAGAVMPHELDKVRANYATVRVWLDAFIAHLPEVQ